MTPEAWHLAMVAALDDYRADLARWVAEPSDENRRRLNLAGAHVDHINAQRPEASAPTTPTSSSAR